MSESTEPLGNKFEILPTKKGKENVCLGLIIKNCEIAIIFESFALPLNSEDTFGKLYRDVDLQVQVFFSIYLKHK